MSGSWLSTKGKAAIALGIANSSSGHQALADAACVIGTNNNASANSSIALGYNSNAYLQGQLSLSSFSSSLLTGLSGSNGGAQYTKTLLYCNGKSASSSGYLVNGAGGFITFGTIGLGSALCEFAITDNSGLQNGKVVGNVIYNGSDYIVNNTSILYGNNLSGSIVSLATSFTCLISNFSGSQYNATLDMTYLQA